MPQANKLAQQITHTWANALSSAARESVRSDLSRLQVLIAQQLPQAVTLPEVPPEPTQIPASKLPPGKRESWEKQYRADIETVQKFINNDVPQISDRMETSQAFYRLMQLLDASLGA